MPNSTSSPTSSHSFADGSIELFAGISLLGVGATWLVGQPVFGAVLPALSIPLWRSFHERVLAGRAADSEPGDAGRRGAVILAAVGIAVLALGVFVYRGLIARDVDLARELVPGLPAALIGLAALISGPSFGSARLALYALPCALAAVGVVAFDLHPGYGIQAAGLAPALWGARRLTRFVRSHRRRRGQLA